MPKELIRDETVYADGSSSPLAVEVAWGANRYVQIASVDTTKKRYTPDAGFYTDLDAPMVDKLMKILRRARESAFAIGDDAPPPEQATPAARRVEYFHMMPQTEIGIRYDGGQVGGSIPVPYLTCSRTDDGRLALVLDKRLGVDLPKMSPDEEDSIVEFIANAIAIGGGYASIYYTDRKVPFRG